MKRKIITLLLAAAVAAAFMGCSSNGTAGETEVSSEQTEAQTVSDASEADESSSGTLNMANPWTDVDTMDEAAEGAGVGSLVFTEDGTETASGMLNWFGYRYTEGIAEVNGGIGAADITVRKGLSSLGDISGDYNDYAYTWELDVDGITVNCSGNTEGEAMLFTWTSGDYNYSVVVRGQGDSYDTYGLNSDTIAPLVSEWIS